MPLGRLSVRSRSCISLGERRSNLLAILGGQTIFLMGKRIDWLFMMAVQAGIVMAESLPEARENGLVRPIEKLFQALWDAQQGSKNPLLTPVALYGQPVPDRRKIIQVWAATWVEARYLRGEEDRKSAATTIARLLSDIEISGKRGGGRPIF